MMQLPSRFSEVDHLDSGGFAGVYVAHDREHGDVAVKVLLTDASDHVERFKREIELQSGLTHPNIVEILDFDLATSPPWYAMNIASGSLASIVGTERYGDDTILSLFGDVLSGVGHAHAQHVLHRDLKPANVLVFGDAAAPIARVSDFGLSRRFTRAEMEYQTASGLGAGTKKFTAPEQWADFREVTETADVFSLGQILAFVMFRRPGLVAKFSRLQKCVDVATRFEPDERYQSVEQLATAVELARMDTRNEQAPHLIISQAIALFLEDPESQVGQNRILDALESSLNDKSAIRLFIARLPDRALMALCSDEYAGRFRVILSVISQTDDGFRMIDVALRDRDAFERCLALASNVSLIATCVYGLARLASEIRMPEFEEPALHHIYNLSDDEIIARTANLIARDALAADWLTVAGDPSRHRIRLEFR